MTIYPIDIARDFNRRWTVMQAETHARRSPPQGTDTCRCGDKIVAPSRSTFAPREVSNYWHCTVCDRYWKTIA